MAKTAIGRYFDRVAELEAASIEAFHVLARELALSGAPAWMARAATRSARDEARHARLARAIAKAHGGGVVARARRARWSPRSLEAIAEENAREGCVRETFGALSAAWQAARAGDEKMAAFFARISGDEARHAALAWAIARWAEPRLDVAARKRVRAARRDALVELRASAAAAPAPSLVRSAGAPSAEQSRLLVAGFARWVQTEA